MSLAVSLLFCVGLRQLSLSVRVVLCRASSLSSRCQSVMCRTSSDLAVSLLFCVGLRQLSLSVWSVPFCVGLRQLSLSVCMLFCVGLRQLSLSVRSVSDFVRYRCQSGLSVLCRASSALAVSLLFCVQSWGWYGVGTHQCI